MEKKEMRETVKTENMRELEQPEMEKVIGGISVAVASDDGTIVIPPGGGGSSPIVIPAWKNDLGIGGKSPAK